MDVPISIGVLLATGLSLYETIRGGEHAWFDGALMLLTFLLAGRVLDAMMRDRARAGVDALLSQAAQGALVIDAAGNLGWLAADALQPGMMIALLPASDWSGRRNRRWRQPVRPVAADRRKRAGDAGAGDKVLAARSTSGRLDVRVGRVGRDTTLAEIARLMAASTQERSR